MPRHPRTPIAAAAPVSGAPAAASRRRRSSAARGAAVLTGLLAMLAPIGAGARPVAPVSPGARTVPLGVVLPDTGSRPTSQQLTRIDYLVASNPFGVAVADLNGDGRLDFVAVNQGSSTVTRWLGDGSGAFADRSDYIVGGGPFSVAVGDLDGDGRPDLAVACINSYVVSVLFADGAGGYRRSDFSTDVTPLSVAIADLNADGKPDIITANHSGHSISVLMNLGGGAFAPPVNLPIGLYPYALAVGDLNHDGRPDVAAVNFYANTVSVRLGNGGTDFGLISAYPTGTNPSSIAIADVNGDGQPDLVVVNSAGNSVEVLYGDGTGQFATQGYYATGTNPVTAVVADLDGDGLPDLAVTNKGSNSISFLIANPAGGFNPRTDFGVGNLPWSVATGDFNGDGARDLVVTNSGDGTASVMLQSGPDNRTPTSTSLTSDINPSAAGQLITLTATVSPASAPSAVYFFDGSLRIGTAYLNAGSAAIQVSTLSRGVHALTAVYGGNATYRPSTSPVLTQTVHGLASATAVSSSPNPSQITQPVSFSATVTAAPPGSGVPTGLVQFQLDGVNVGSPAQVVTGVATIDPITSLTPGNHSVVASYLGDTQFDPSTSTAFTQVVSSPNPVIAGVRDVPNDQGGRVFLTWRCPLDQPGLRIVTSYRVWRRAPPPAAARAGRAPNARAQDETFWEAIATLPAEQLVSYAYTAATSQDSIAGSNPYTAFFVTALTSDPFTFYESAPDSGYSVDNLSPPTPAPFEGVYGPLATALHWGVSPAPDLGEFRLYRGGSPDFVPGPTNLIAVTRDTGYVDPVRTPYVYKLQALDIHGNASRYALVTPNGAVAVLASLASIAGAPDRIRIAWSAPANPGLVATVYRRTATSGWSMLAIITANASGDMSYVDTQVVSGQLYGYRLGIMDAGVEVFVGEAWALADATVFALEGARPNPATGGDLNVWFSLPGAAPARLELLDVGGRKLAAREVGGLGPGRHAVNLGQGLGLAPGIYLVRLSQAGTERVSRVAVIR